MKKKLLIWLLSLVLCFTLCVPAFAEEQTAEAATVEEQEAEAAPVEEQEAEAAPVEEQEAEAATVEEQEAEAAPVEEQEAEAAPVEEQEAEAAPVEEQDVEAAPEEQQDVEAAMAAVPEHPEKVTVYFCSYTTPELPDEYAGSYMLPVPKGAKNVSCQLTSGDTLEISAEGQCTPKPEVWYVGNGYATKEYIEGAESYTIYREGSNTVNVSWDGGSYDMTVNVARYQSVSFEKYVQNTVNTIITEDMTDVQKYEEIAKHVAEEYSYMVNFSGAESMYLNGGGDCWASTDMIITLGTAAGLDVRQRPEVGTSMFGGGHMNAIAKIGDTYYVAEAGFTEKKPRHYSVWEEPYGMTISGTSLVNYDGWGSENVIIPDFITTIGDGSHNAFWYRRNEIRQLTLGAGVTSIAPFALGQIDVSFDVSAANTALKVVNGVLYSADGTQLFAVPYGQTSLVIEEGTKEAIANCAYYCENLKSVVFPESMEIIGEGAFFSCSSLSAVSLPASVKQIDNYAFYNGPGELTIYADDTVFGENVVDSETVIYGHTGSTAETWAAGIGAVFKTIKPAIVPEKELTGWMYLHKKFSTAELELPIVYDGDTVVSGTWKLNDPNGMSYNIGEATTYATFTPDDTESYNALLNVPVHLSVYYDIRNAYIEQDRDDYKYTGKPICPQFSVMYWDSYSQGSIELKEGTDYTISYEKNVNPGTANVTFTGIGSAKGTLEHTFTIYETIDISTVPANVYFLDSCICDGTAKTPEFYLYLGDGWFTPDKKQLDIRYSNNIQPGMAKLTITGKGDKYSGTREFEFYIAPLDTPSITKVSGAASGVTITWKAVDGAAKYRIFRAVGTGSYSKLKDLSACSFTDKTVEAGKKYKYYICCLSSNAKVLTSGKSAAKTITYTAAPKLPTLSNVKGGVKISWKAVSGAVNYRVLRKTGTGSWKKVADTKDLTCTDKTAASGKTYSYTIRCLSSDGKVFTGGYNTTGKKIKYIAAPALPTVKNTSTGIKVTWKKVTGAEKYRVYRKLGSGSWKKLADTKNLTYVDKTAVKGKTYKYTIRCVSADGKTVTSGYNTTGVKILRS